MNLLYIFIATILLYLIIVLLMFKYIFSRNRGPLAFFLKKTKINGHFMKGFESIIEEGTNWANAQPFRDVYITSKDNLKLHGLYLENPSANRTVICVHGYRSNGFHDFSVALKDIYNLNNNLLVISQRSQGKSQGKYISFGIKESDDCISWANYLLETKGIGHKVYFDGVSMGASSVILACGKNIPENVAGVIVDCGFSSPWDIINKSIKDVFGRELKFTMTVLCILAKIIIGIDIKNTTMEKAARNCKIPCIIAHGTKDDIVPYDMAVKLYNAYGADDKVLVTGEGANHGMSYITNKDYYTKKFVELFEK